MSRQPSWDLALELQADMFKAVKAVGGLDVQLVYFRGYQRMPGVEMGRRSRCAGAADAPGILRRRLHADQQGAEPMRGARARPPRSTRWSMSAMHGGRCRPAGQARRRARHDRHAGVPIPGGTRPQGRARLQGDRPALARAPIARSMRARRGSCASCSPLSRSMPRAARKALKDFSEETKSGGSACASSSSSADGLNPWPYFLAGCALSAPAAHRRAA